MKHEYLIITIIKVYKTLNIMFIINILYSKYLTRKDYNSQFHSLSFLIN